MSVWSSGSAANTIGWFIKCGDKILCRNGGLGHIETLLNPLLLRNQWGSTNGGWYRESVHFGLLTPHGGHKWSEQLCGLCTWPLSKCHSLLFCTRLRPILADRHLSWWPPTTQVEVPMELLWGEIASANKVLVLACNNVCLWSVCV